MIRRLVLPALVVVLLAGCGDTKGEPGPNVKLSDRLVDFSLKPPYVNALDVDPASGDFLLTTNKGFWRINPKSSKITRIKGKIAAAGETDTVGTFLEIETVGPNKLIGSGHPDHKDTLPQFLGFIKSDDNGKSWDVVSRLGDADLHKIVLAHGKMYAFDAVLGAMLISEDEGRTFTERFTPKSLIIDFVVDPEDEKHILATTSDTMYLSSDEGESWRPATTGNGIRLAWPAPGKVYRADQDGSVLLSTDGGRTFKPISKVPGEAYKFKTTDDPDHVFLALSDGTIVETADGARTWKTVFTP